jgi:hypothetical protein
MDQRPFAKFYCETGIESIMTKGTNSTDLLRRIIQEKEAELKAEGAELRTHFYATYESMKPANIIRNTIKDLFSTPDLSNDVVNSVIGVATGLVAREVVVGKSKGLLNKFVGMAVEMVVASNVIGNGDEIRAMAKVLLKRVLPTAGETKNTG